MEGLQGRVTVAPPVLTTIVRQTTLEEKGVNRLAPLPARMRGLRAGAALEEGILVGVSEQGVYVEVHIVAEPGAQVLKLGAAVQCAVTRAVEEMVGMNVVAVDVHIDDVARAAVSAE